MIGTLTLRNYRGFEDYRFENLARVNLLVGRNNSGKTAALEAIQLLATRGDRAVFSEITRRRGEQVWIDRSEKSLPSIALFSYTGKPNPDTSLVQTQISMYIFSYR